MIRKFLAELIGTAVLVMIGCGTAMSVGCDSFSGTGYLLTALAFGLAIVAMAYSIGNASGCHINPAVSLGMLMTGRMNFLEFFVYIIAQCAGAICGAFGLYWLFTEAGITDLTGALGSNSLEGVHGSLPAGMAVELVLTCIFVLVVLGVTDERYHNGRLAGLVIGLSLTFVHIFGIGFTGTSVNPARSLGPALVCWIYGNTAPMGNLLVFIFAPLAGGVVAAALYLILTFHKKGKEEKAKADEMVK